MEDTEQDFYSELSEKYSKDDCAVITNIIDKILENDSDEVDSDSKWIVCLSKEKHDALNYTYHIDLHDSEDGEINVSFYTGIDVGCEMVDYSFDGKSLLSEPKTVSVLADLKINKGLIPKNRHRIAEIILKTRKAEIMEIYSKQAYDNYVTGGGTNKTDDFYKSKFKKYHDNGLFWHCIYKDEIVDRHIIKTQKYQRRQ